MKSEIKSTFILCIYIIIMLAICALSVRILKQANHTDNVTTEDSDPQTADSNTPAVTQIVYIPIITETDSEAITETQIENETTEFIYTVKSYEGKIGIFTDSGALVRVLEVYIKTLPKADQNMLEKGVLVTSEAELHSIIEDYTG